jgi:putative PIN family toxin of toxin-antitoxin system
MLWRNKKTKIIIDTNLWISFLITGNYSNLDAVLSNKNIQLLFSQKLWSEFMTVVTRTKFKKYFSEDDVAELIPKMRKRIKMVKIKTTINICRDVKDNFLLELATDGKADFLVTGDNDLLSLKTIQKTSILTIHDFLKKSQKSFPVA